MQKICIIIPCYNEEKRLAVEKYEDFYKSSSVSLCFVNDGSTDNTLGILRKLQTGKEDRYFIIRLVLLKSYHDIGKKGLSNDNISYI